MLKTPIKTAEGRSHVRRALVFTIGHSTRSIETFIEMLKAHGVKRLVDVRTIPRSRHNPQFNRDVLPETLLQAGIGYTHMEELGGLRHARKDSLNTGWRNASFRGFADYMQTPEFAAGLKTLIQTAKREQVAIMCAEAVPWRCHRSLIGDALRARGIAVEDIMSATRTTGARTYLIRDSKRFTCDVSGCRMMSTSMNWRTSHKSHSNKQHPRRIFERLREKRRFWGGYTVVKTTCASEGSVRERCSCQL